MYKLLVNIDGYWKQLSKCYSETELEKLYHTASQLSDDTEWEIVKVLRYHSGQESMTVTG